MRRLPAVLAFIISLVLRAHAVAQQPTRPEQQQPIRVGVELIAVDAIVRDRNGRFVPNLGKNDFELFEDGVRQEITTFTMTLGGRVYNIAAPAASVRNEGLVLPPRRVPSDANGRVFVIFIDDSHLDARNTPRLRDLLRKISTELIHEGDLFGIVSTGLSSISADMTYDRKRLDAAIDRVMGNGLSPREILDTPEGSQGPPEVRHRAHVAFSTAWEIIQNLAKVQHRRKAFVYISNGYDFAPFQQTRARLEAERYARPGDSSGFPDVNPFSRTASQFTEADLAAELAELTRAANRANVTLYTIDPRGLVGGPDIDQDVDPVEWQDYVRKAQDSLRVLADLTGGIAIVNRNDFVSGLKRIDSETSDYYVLGYHSSDPDPAKRRRVIEVRATRPGLQVQHRREYVLAPRTP